ncbi:hypothetical protein BHM03_00019909 [Ensete ventricosum]|nr:hypothetical protein BHM03_00019909 [Ensete ventricosum]
MFVHKAKDTDKHEHFIKHLVYILTVTVWKIYFKSSSAKLEEADQRPSYGEGRRSVKGEGRRRGCLKKRENQENLDAKPFLDLDPASPSLDNPNPGGNDEEIARAAEEAVSFVASSVTLWLLRCVLRRRP